MADPAHVPQLDHDAPTFGMHRIGHFAPCGDLAFGMDAGGLEVPFALGADLGGFGDDDACARALAVILDMHVRDFASLVICTVAGQRGHHQTVVGHNLTGGEGGK